ncbi:stimulator of interferon genes protein isoform X2 [Venturia canescens]|uniref:stimulator of interferon genes protein isoform X2 n=1 Tax=Venturia canescens TaxID=32260 RepID=UPI001C9C93BC|nr:stimulator of interferon genes protein isoform X2 [Venturia canescens]
MIIKPENFTYTQTMSLQSDKNSYLISNSILIVILSLVSIRCMHKDNYAKAAMNTVSSVSLFNLILVIAELIFKIYYFVARIMETGTKHASDFEKIVKNLQFNTTSWMCIAFSCGLLFWIFYVYAGNNIGHIWEFGPVRLFPSLLLSLSICQIVGLKDSAFETVMGMNSMKGVDYGTGMAYSYYYGYLRLILPSDGGQNPGLRHKMEQYEGVQNVTIPVKKLFILIPESGHIPPNLKEASDGWLESTTSLESEVRDRAGVTGRPYKNTVYKIHPGGGERRSRRPIYVTTEGATPMMTLWEILRHAHPQTDVYREHRHEIVVRFYETLKELLNSDPSCRDSCELVYYNDYDANGKKANVGEILLTRILSQTPSPTW